ncbi:putative DNA topoisomerase 2 [Tritrichomonas foetus]|uniref:DNA topoisomerase 2 n=1 Tax=Tritrichomonas foetus TaxID=1144522 RepID=A0A1J4KFE1_9EUKA|nr:putative DNA topoisomerase 2 [Tritrichomonas foetus]|eukprot:OHT08318.1 putative DNA topoisomerase 2 [Tritrichomonas foetus]
MSDDYSSDDQVSNTTSGTETADENYMKYELREHVLKRPENYIGSTQVQTEELYVVVNDKLEKRNVTYVPGLYKIFDEILVNAADNAQRQPPTKKIQVEINQEEGFISVWNDGKGIPIAKKFLPKENEEYWIPEFIFGQLLTSSNFDDTKKRTTGGRNGFGAKLANIYSNTFIVECISTNGVDNDTYYHYTQKFTDHMENIEKPKIITLKKKKVTSSTMIKFYPDCSLFGMDRLDDDIVSLFKKRVWDMAGVLKGVTVLLNGEKVPVKNFEDYCKKYLDENATFLSCEVNDRWKIGIAASDGQFGQVSFVNSVATTRGGTHVDYVANQITKYICKELENSRGNKITVRPNIAKYHIFVFVNCLIDNPSFDSQTKETLMLKVSEFGSKCDVPEAFLKKIMKQTEIPGLIRDYAKFKQNSDMKKMGGRKTARIHGILKLTDANEAGKAKSSQCTLILTEGDSAKTMAVTGLSVIGRDLYGVFPLRGKLLNTRDITTAKLQKNEEIQNLMKILALKPGTKYNDKESLKDLRYGSIMIMTDQDQDGSHIKGLIINFIHSMWPELIKQKGFLCEFVTPIVKVFKGNTSKAFYTLPEFIQWKKEHDDAKGYSIKYYKGLATSSDEETKEYFSAFKRHKITFQFSGETDEERIQLAFSKKRADDRKNWLAELDPDTTYLGQDTPTITYTDFINKELILFSNYANVRAIPSAVDGLKPGQRKILWVSLKNNLRKDLKVVQLAGKVSEQSAYHHGEDSLNQTIIAMAQAFVGTNNINLFYPSGQFGSRNRGGEDAGSPRYIYTRLSQITRAIFHKDDDQLLEYLTDEGIPIEPKYYVPIIPMVLVNGSNGIGVGWSSNVPNFNPLDIIKNIRHKINDEEMEEMMPWYSGFTGTITKSGEHDGMPTKWTCSGKAEIITDEMIEIKELPIQVWTEDYKQFLDNMFTGEQEKKKADKTKEKNAGKPKKGEKEDTPAKFEPLISDVKEYHTNVTVHFEVYCNSEQMDRIKEIGLDKFFKLTKTINATNMTLFSPEGRIKQYKRAEEIIDDFYPVRIQLYEERKAAILEDLAIITTRLTNQARFIKEFIEKTIELRNIPRKDILLNLKLRKYDLMESAKKKIPKKVAEDAVIVDEDNEEEETLEEASQNAEIETLARGYNYLLSMKIWTLTKEKYNKLLKEVGEAESKMEEMRNRQPKEMWLSDLADLEKEYIEFEKEREKKRQENLSDAAKSKTKSKSKANIAKIKKKPPTAKEEKPDTKAETKAGTKKQTKLDLKKAGDSRSDVDSQADENQPSDKKPAMSPSKKKAAATQRKPRAKKSDKSTTDDEQPKKKAPAKRVKKEVKVEKSDSAFVDEDDDDEPEASFDESSSHSSSEDEISLSMIAQNRKKREASKVKKFESEDDDDIEEIEDDDDEFNE